MATGSREIAADSGITLQKRVLSAFLAWTAIGLIWSFIIKMRNPRVIRAAGTWGDASDPAAGAEAMAGN